MKYLLLIPLLTACAPQLQVGMAMNQTVSEDYPFYSPLGVIRVVDKGFNNTELFCEHVSSIPDSKDKGLNMCGAIWRIK